MARLFQSLIQSDYGSGNKNFEAVVLEGRDLYHWWRDNSDTKNPWYRGRPIIEGCAAFPGSIIQSSFGDGDSANFEVVVPLFAEGGLVELWHLWRHNTGVNNPWTMGLRITEAGRKVVGPASIIQSDFGTGDNGNFEVVVPVLNDVGHAELRHYWHDNSHANNPWMIAQRINDPTHKVLGGGSIIQSDFGTDSNSYEVAAWVKLPDGRSVLQHYWHDNSSIHLPWQNGQVIADGARGNGVMIRSSLGPDHNNFEVVVPVHGPEGRTHIQHVWRENNTVNAPWHLGQVISEIAPAGASASIIQSDYNSGSHGNFEVLLDECSQSLVDYWHQNDDEFLPWIRHHKLLIGEPPNRSIYDTARICQLTGQYDRAGWNGEDDAPFAFNKTESRYGIRGTDLGVSFEHKNRLYFLFGDTWRVGEDKDSHFDWDAIALCTDTKVQGGLSLTFNQQQPIVHGISQGEYEVPLDGFSYGELMYCFFSTDHRKVGGAHMMGRSLLARSENDGKDFEPLLNFAKEKFINVSVEQGSLDAEQAEVIEWAKGTDVLWVWGSGRYRSSPAYFAVINVEDLMELVRSRFDGSPLELVDINNDGGPVKFLCGTGENVDWSPYEQEAVPLFCSGDIGELCGRRNNVFDRYFLTYNTANPRGITLRHAAQPWGRWSEGIIIFDPGWPTVPPDPDREIGYGTFMHVPWNERVVDYVQDDAFLEGRRDYEWGGEYGAYQISRFSTGEAGVYCDLHYTMSTWNPYQVMLMRTRITADDLFGP